ncbi:MAG: Chromosome (plasmid) partitioning protein ParB [uncultured Chloroflexi bacterium]|uniref:Chromosome (Plasmid) partitioning protein ParB n=1 Tax=uncultured Chloroflexota bacterium TaxID=166587 RepID=A0A6J4H3P3_9CHLR|nr:MAG: Chromosome (plasmid) partitioning protein ParB [uncultured Chloroflexota bacterium]
MSSRTAVMDRVEKRRPGTSAPAGGRGPATSVGRGSTGSTGGRGTPAERSRNALADVLRRRSAPAPGEREAQTSAIHASLNAVTRGTTGAVVDVPLEQLHANPFQPRFHFQRRPLEELAQSLASEGQLEPVIARRVVRDGREILEVVAGERRLQAARICSATLRPFPTLRADIRDLTDEEAERLSLVENLQRENLTPLEEGYRYWQLQQRDVQRWSVRAIAEFVHKKKSTVQNRLGLVKEPAVAEAVLREHIPPTAGFQIMRLPATERVSYLDTAIEQRLTVEQVKTDIDRRLAPRRSPVTLRLDRTRRNGESPADEDEGEVLVRTHTRRQRRGADSTPEPGDRATPEAREALEVERREILTRVEELESELRGLYLRLRAIDKGLALAKA